MPDSFSVPHWLWPGDDRPTEEIDDEIAAELRFHLDMLAEECEQEGMEIGTAKQRAAERFGDIDWVLRRCRAEKQGDVPMLRRLQTVLVSVLLAAVLVVGWQQWVIANRVGGTMLVMKGFSDRLSELKDMLIRLEDEPSAEPTTSVIAPEEKAQQLELRVVDAANQPISGARLLFETVNTAGDHYDFFDMATNPSGTITTPLSDDGFRLSSVTAYAPGYTISRETLRRPFKNKAVVTISLPKGSQTRFRMMLQPKENTESAVELTLPGVLVYPAVMRHSAIVTPVRTNSEGILEVDWFAEGDVAGFHFDSPDRSLSARGVVVDTTSAEPIRVEVREQQRYGMAGGGQF